MLKRENILKILEDATTEENIAIISEYIDMVASLDNKDLAEILKQRGIRTENDVKKFIREKTTTQLHDFKPLNDLISFGTSGATLHIHVIPKDLHSMLGSKGMKKAELQLIDALDKLKGILSTDEGYKNINKVYAVSNLIRKPISNIFERLGFDVKSMFTTEAKNDPELSKFYSRFKDGKMLGRAELPKEKMLSEEWGKHIAARKEELERSLGNGFLELLGSQVNTEITEEEIEAAGEVHPNDIVSEKLADERT